MARPDPRIALLLDVLDHAYEGPGWHGPTLKGALRGLTPRQAAWRPAPGRNCIWDLVLHAAYWKYAVRRRLAGGGRGGFPRAPSNFPRLPDVTSARALRDDLALLDAEHRALRATIAAFDPRRLQLRGAKKQWRNAETVFGIAAHDLYHTGQIQLIKRLMR